MSTRMTVEELPDGLFYVTASDGERTWYHVGGGFGTQAGAEAAAEDLAAHEWDPEDWETGCKPCAGRGEFVSGPCRTCNGTGRVTEQQAKVRWIYPPDGGAADERQ